MTSQKIEISQMVRELFFMIFQEFVSRYWIHKTRCSKRTNAQLKCDLINTKVLLYSTRDYIQYLIIMYNGKEYIYIYESVCYVPETDMLQTNYTWNFYMWLLKF